MSSEKLDPDKCPHFEIQDEASVEAILKWGEVELEFVEPETYISPKGKEATFQNGWAFTWNYGFWQMTYNKEDLKYARLHAAIFIFLWCRSRVGLPFVDCLASAYTYNEKGCDERRNLPKTS